MSRVCAITGKRPVKGRKIIHKGQSKKSGGIGLQLVKQNKRTFKPNVQRVRVRAEDGSVKRLWVCTKAIKAGLVEKAQSTRALQNSLPAAAHMRTIAGGIFFAKICLKNPEDCIQKLNIARVNFRRDFRLLYSNANSVGGI